MDAALIRRLSGGFVPVAALFVLLIASLYLMGRAIQNSEEFADLYVWLFAVNVLELILLLYLIGANMMRLVRQYRAGATGSRLTVRLVAMFVLLAVVPVSIVYYFSLDFLRRGIDSWFDVRVEKALDDALELSRTVLDGRMRDLLRQAEAMAQELAHVPTEQAAAMLNELSDDNETGELSLLTVNGRIIASSGGLTTKVLPAYPNEAIMLQIRQGVTYVGLDDVAGFGLNIRVVVPLAGAEGRLLQALYPMPERVAALADNVQSTYSRYEQLVYLREPLKFSFTITLSLVLLLSLLTAVWVAFYAARRLVAPIRTLAIGTRAVASGDYDRRLPMAGNDEFGQLVQSFNDMTGRLALARDEASRSQQQVEGQRAYLEAVLGRLSSGVLVLDAGQQLRTANAAAGLILGVELAPLLGRQLKVLSVAHPHLGVFAEELADHLADADQEWREEITLFGAAGRQVLMCGGTSLPMMDGDGPGYVVVFENITALIQAQRDAAWAEMARRLAHEIKNPLTPIQLSAERLRHKYLKQMNPDESQLLDRCTHTIIQQVEAMQEMVKAFSEYARTPKLERRSLDLNRLIGEVLDLYHGHSPVEFNLDLDQSLPPVEVDPGRFRQLLHNLLKNAIEALAGRPTGRIMITTRRVEEAGFPLLELRVADNGPGFSGELQGQVFEPYVTTKLKGSGLGLAIVKKIVEEHGGMITAENAEGACIVVRLPLEGVVEKGAIARNKQPAATTRRVGRDQG